MSSLRMKILNCVILNFRTKFGLCSVFKRGLFFSPTLCLFDHKYNSIHTNTVKHKYSKTVIYCELFLQLKNILIYLKMWWQSCIFSIITPVVTITWSFRNQSKILIWCSSKNNYYLFSGFFEKYKFKKKSFVKLWIYHHF